MRTYFSVRVSPPKLGGVDVRPSDFAKPPLMRTGGVVPKPKRFRGAFFKRFGEGTTPSAPLRLLRDICLVAATPPNLGGDTLAEKEAIQS